MKTRFFQTHNMFLLFTALIFLVTGCGSGGTARTNDTGAIAAKLVWNAGSSSALAKAPEKTLLLAPTGVATVRIIVSGADMTTNVQKDFPAGDGSGTVPGVPVGNNRTVKAQGLDSGGTVLYQGTITGITVTVGQTANAGTITLVDAVPPVTAAAPAGGNYNAAQNVTLTANEPATIYYTTNGTDPSNLSPNGPHTGVSITISTATTLKFFAIDTALNQEAVKIESYTFN